MTTAPKMAGLQEVRRTRKDGSTVLFYRVQINRKNFKVDKFFEEHELEEAIELINASKSLTGKSKIKLIDEQNKAEQKVIADFLQNPTLEFYIDKYINSYVLPKFSQYDPETPYGKFKLRNLVNIKSFYKNIKTTEIQKRSDEKFKLSPAILENILGKQRLGLFKPTEITEIQINEFILALLKRGLKPISVQRHITHISNVYRKLKYIDPNLKELKNPCLDYDKDLLKINGNLITKKPFRLTEDESKKLFEELEKYPNPELKQIIQLILFTALRRSEAVLLKWSQVEEHLIYLTHTKSNRPRSVYLTPQAKALLNSIPKRDGDDRVFTYGLDGFYGSLTKFMKRIGLNHITAKALRKESISMFIENIGGQNSLLIAEFLGLASVRKLEENINNQTVLNGLNSQSEVLKSIGHTNPAITQNHYFSLKK